MDNWSNFAKRSLKAEMVRRGLNSSDLVILLKRIGIVETKASIDSKISRGTFSASFFLQMLSVMGCDKIEISSFKPSNEIGIAAGPFIKYEKLTNGK